MTIGSRLAPRLVHPFWTGPLDAVVEKINADVDALDRLLGAQHYRLAYWRTASQRIPCPGLEQKKIVLFSDEGIIAEDNTILMPEEAVAIVIAGKDEPLFEIEKTQ